MKRLGYRKSRTGCLRCKERRVKCNEERPCSACVRHRVSCSLGGSPPDLAHAPPIPVRLKRPRKKQTAPASSKSPGPLSAGSGDGTPVGSSTSSVRSSSVPSSWPAPSGTEDSSSIDPFIYFAKLFADIKPAPASHCLADIELIHHYTAVSYRTLSVDPRVQEALQYDVPRLALTSPFLLHQILAFSGYHLAYLQKDRRHAYLVQAAQHQNLAIEGVRTTIAESVTADNCHSLFATSILLTICAFAILPSYDRYDGSFDPMVSILDIIHLIKGMSIIRESSQDRIKTGPLMRIFGMVIPPQPPATSLSLDRIHASVVQLQVSLRDREASPPVLEAAAALGDCITQVSFSKPTGTSVELRAAFLWPILVPGDFVELVNGREAGALVVLAYYCTILHVAEPSCWVVQGWAESLMKCILGGLRGTAWEGMIEWPVEVTSTC